MSEILSGIYKIYCKDTNKYYIGQSINVESRLKQHLNELKSNKHINKELQADFNTYGEGSFIFEKIEDSKEEHLNMFEKYYMEYYNSLEEGYNVIPINNLIKDKYKVKNSLDFLKNIEPIEVPLVAGDVYVMELLFKLFCATESALDSDTYISTDKEGMINSIDKFAYKRCIEFFDEIQNIVELELRRKFNRAGIKCVEIDEIENIDEVLDTKILVAKIWTDNKDFARVNIKCAK